MGVTHDGILWCLLRGKRSMAMPPDPYAAASAVLHSVPRVYAMWYAVLPALGEPQLHPQHQYPRVGQEATAQAWFTALELVRAWRLHRGVQVVFHVP